MLNVPRKGCLLAGLTTALLLSTSLATPYLNAAQAAPQNPVDTPQWQAAVHGHYGYCDADVLRQHWGTNIDDAKIRLGEMILSHQTQLIADELGVAYLHHKCTASFDLIDAPKLAELWTASSVA
jgi:hypothetical protein